MPFMTAAEVTVSTPGCNMNQVIGCQKVPPPSPPSKPLWRIYSLNNFGLYGRRNNSEHRVSVAHYVAFMNLIVEQHAPGGKEDGVSSRVITLWGGVLVSPCCIHPLWSATLDRPLPQLLSLLSAACADVITNMRTWPHVLIGVGTDCCEAVWCFSFTSAYIFSTRSDYAFFHCNIQKYWRLFFFWRESNHPSIIWITSNIKYWCRCSWNITFSKNTKTLRCIS